MFDHRQFFCSLLLASGAASRWIVPGGRWLDTDGNRVNAHAGNVYYDEPSGKYWLYGEYKTEETPEGGGISAYSSPDLVTWEFHGLALGKRHLNLNRSYSCQNHSTQRKRN